MPPVAANEKEGGELGTPQTPAGGLRPPAPPLSSYLSRANAKVIIHDALSILPLRYPPLRLLKRRRMCSPPHPEERKSVARRAPTRRATLFLSLLLPPQAASLS